LSVWVDLNPVAREQQIKVEQVLQTTQSHFKLVTLEPATASKEKNGLQTDFRGIEERTDSYFIVY
jgi:hypothetical protein